MEVKMSDGIPGEGNELPAQVNAVLKEREACALIAEKFLWWEHPSCSPDEGNTFIAKIIRERSNASHERREP
jgi:hypothetical protein